MAQTLDQKRAALAWGYATASGQKYGKEYKGPDQSVVTDMPELPGYPSPTPL